MATGMLHRVITAVQSLVRWGILVLTAVAELQLATRAAMKQHATVQVAVCSDIDFSDDRRFAVISQLPIQVIRWDIPVARHILAVHPMVVMA